MRRLNFPAPAGRVQTRKMPLQRTMEKWKRKDQDAMEIVVSNFMLDGLEKGGVCEEGERKNFSFSVHVWKERENSPRFVIEMKFQFIAHDQKLSHVWAAHFIRRAQSGCISGN